MSVFKKINSLINNQGAMMYLKNTSWLLFEKTLKITAGLFIGIWVARYLGPEDFGEFSFALSFVGLFIALATLGLDGIVIRNLVNNQNQRNQILGSAFFLKFIGSILVLLLITISTTFFLDSDNTSTLILIIASATVFQSFNVIDFYFQSKVLSKYVVYCNIITLFLSSSIKILLIINNAPLMSFAYVILLESILLAVGLIYFYYKNGLDIRHWLISKTAIYPLLKDSWPLILSGLVVSIYMNIDQVMINHMLSTKAVGEYAAAIRISEALYFIPMVISASLFPAIINAKKTSQELYHNRLQKLYDIMVWLAIFIAIPMSIFASHIIHFLYGAQYAQASEVLVVHIWTGVFIFLGLSSAKWFITENLQSFLFYRSIIGALINIILNYILIPQYGIQGAAIATLTAQLVASYLFNLSHKRLLFTFKLQTKALLLPARMLNKF